MTEMAEPSECPPWMTLVNRGRGVRTTWCTASACVSAVSNRLDVVMNVYRTRILVALAAGVAIAVLGALIPARAAARTTIAEVLHNE